MSSKQVTDRQRTAAFVEAAVDTHGSAAARIVEEKLRLFAPSEPSPPGDTGVAAGTTAAPNTAVGTAVEPNVEALLQRLADSLRIAREELVAADEAHLRELDDDPQPRRLRDAVAAQVYTEVSRLRAVARGLFGPEAAVELLGVDGKTAADPLLLHRQAARIVERFADPKTVFPTIEVPGAELSPEVWADRLRPQVERLGAALDEVHRQRKAAESTLMAKQEAQEQFDRTYQGVARTVEGVFGLADLKDLADRVRPRRRKPYRQDIPEVYEATIPAEEPASGVAVELAPDLQIPPESPPPLVDGL